MSITKKERESLRLKLAKFELPEWAKFVAVDLKGQVWAYEKKPKIYEGTCAWNSMSACDGVGNIGACLDWRETLFTVKELRAPKRSHKKKVAPVEAKPAPEAAPQPEEKVLSIYLKRIHSTLVFAVLDQKGLPEQKSDGVVRINQMPIVTETNICLRGSNWTSDKRIDKHDYDFNKVAEEKLKFFIDAIGVELFPQEQREPKAGDIVAVRETSNGEWQLCKYISTLTQGAYPLYACWHLDSDTAHCWRHMRTIPQAIQPVRYGDVYTWRARA